MQLLSIYSCDFGWLGCFTASVLNDCARVTAYAQMTPRLPAVPHSWLSSLVEIQLDIFSLVPRACIMLVAGQSVVEHVAYATELFLQHHQLSAGQLDSQLSHQLFRAASNQAALETCAHHAAMSRETLSYALQLAPCTLCAVEFLACLYSCARLSAV